MHLFHAQPARSVLRSTSFEAIASQFFAWIASNLRRRSTPVVESPYKGRAWTDSAERELNDNVASYRSNRF